MYVTYLQGFWQLSLSFYKTFDILAYLFTSFWQFFLAFDKFPQLLTSFLTHFKKVNYVKDKTKCPRGHFTDHLPTPRGQPWTFGWPPTHPLLSTWFLNAPLLQLLWRYLTNMVGLGWRQIRDWNFPISQWKPKTTSKNSEIPHLESLLWKCMLNIVHNKAICLSYLLSWKFG